MRRSGRLGTLDTAVATVRHLTTADVEEIVIAFRPGGGPVYTAQLATTAERYERDLKAFKQVLEGFRLEPWR